ncbi:hypothetical protein Y032_0063g3462 [Ancylostoma ceylanicum]|uniref:Uncharacterized protein n=2 Tax=Ancylostoma ceylanicum TaxID=53326 RepID=A0A016U2Z9_9BILA|nr:hypothetical protein Y032_0063g3462 [Ancylostoma ceylanicum]
MNQVSVSSSQTLLVPIYRGMDALPAIQRVSDLVPLEEGIDPEYPAQRIVISNFVRNGCHVKRWLYEDSYPVDGPRPTFRGLMETGRQRKQLRFTL